MTYAPIGTTDIVREQLLELLNDSDKHFAAEVNDFAKELQLLHDEQSENQRSLEQRNFGYTALDRDQLWTTVQNECPGEVYEPTTSDWLSQDEPEDDIPF
jgi:hypothetical protein|tara:strand:- start:909 stop:1208 length:300 start_codon:yes stop_codon:yes gene_type:complete